MSSVRDRRLPSIRHIEPELRRKRLLAARGYAAGSVPRLAIMLGHWDAGEVVRLGAMPAKRKRRGKVRHG